jgi:tRNA (cmo5U34)-methyltransferase
LASAVRAAVPGAGHTLLDGSADMLEAAHRRLGDRVRLVAADLTDPLPAGPFDAVVSALAVHHLDDAAKRQLFGRILGVLMPGGIFVNAEQIAGPTPWHERQYADVHERDARRAGSDDVEWGGALQRMAHDRCATLDNQLLWLREVGFERVDVAYKRYRFAVFAGFAPS